LFRSANLLGVALI